MSQGVEEENKYAYVQARIHAETHYLQEDGKRALYAHAMIPMHLKPKMVAKLSLGETPAAISEISPYR